MRRSRRDLAAALALGLLAGCGSEPETVDSPAATDLTGIRFLGGGVGDGFERALAPAAFAFPADHGPHPAYRNEWWYFTGNLLGAGGRHFGFELTFFRFGLLPPATASGVAPETATVWMAHFAVTDTQRGQFHAGERLARGHPALAFAQSAPLEVRVEDWQLTSVRPGAVMLSATDGGYELELELDGVDDVVPQGDRGLDAKGPEPGNASYYYSAPRLRAAGRLSTPDGDRQRVEGTAWLDREWGTSALSPGVVGWDWFALQLSDGSDLMYYRLRDSEGRSSDFSGGSLRGPDGTARRISDAGAAPTGFWTSPETGIRYPVAWRLRLPAEGLDLEVTPVIENQELDLTVRYWEGAVRVTGTGPAGAIDGRGYLELAGYQ